MAQLVIPDVDETLFQRLRERAAEHGRTAEAEATLILKTALQTAKPDPWAAVDQIRERLASTGRDFGDSTESIREDRRR